MINLQEYMDNKMEELKIKNYDYGREFPFKFVEEALDICLPFSGEGVCGGPTGYNFDNLVMLHQDNCGMWDYDVWKWISKADECRGYINDVLTEERYDTKNPDIVGIARYAMRDHAYSVLEQNREGICQMIAASYLKETGHETIKESVIDKLADHMVNNGEMTREALDKQLDEALKTKAKSRDKDIEK